MANITLLLLSLACFQFLDHFFKYRKTSFIIAHIPFLAFAINLDMMSALGIYIVFYSIIVWKNFKLITNKRSMGLNFLALLWLPLFIWNINTIISFSLIIIFVEVLKNILSTDMKLLLNNANGSTLILTILILEVVVMNFFNIYIPESIHSSYLMLILLFFIILNNAESEKVCSLRTSSFTGMFENLNSAIDYLVKPLVILFYVNNTKLTLDLEFKFHLVLGIVMLLLVFSTIKSVIFRNSKNILSRIASFNVFGTIVLFLLSREIDLEVTFLVLFVNYVVFELLSNQKAESQVCIWKMLLKGILFCTPISPIFIYKLILMKDKLLLQDYLSVGLMLVFLIFPMLILPFHYEKRLNYEKV